MTLITDHFDKVVWWPNGLIELIDLALPECNGMGALCYIEGSGPLPLLRRANKAQIDPRDLPIAG